MTQRLRDFLGYIGSFRMLRVIRRRSEILMTLLMLATLSVYVFGRTLVVPRGNMIFGMDLISFLYFVMEFLVENIRKGIVPFWNPYMLSGTPALANPAGGSMFYPVNVIFFLMPLPYAFAFNYVFHIVLAGLGIWRYACKYVDRISALTSAVILMFGGYMMGAVFMGHPETVAAMAWVAYIIHSFEEWMRTGNRRYGALTVVFLALQILTGTHIAVLFTLEFMGILFVEWCVTVFRRVSLLFIIYKTIASIMLVGLAVGISAYQLLPFWELTGQSIRSEGLPYEVTSRLSFQWNLWYIFFEPLTAADTLYEDSASQTSVSKNLNLEYLFFIGKIPGVLVLIAFLRELWNLFRYKRINRRLFVYGFALVIFIALAFGDNLPFYKFLYTVFLPYRLVRRPIRHLMIAAFLLPIIAGYAVSLFRNRAMRFVILVIVTAELVTFAKKYIRVNPEPWILYDKNIIELLKQNDSTDRIYLNYRDAGIAQTFFNENAGWRYRIYTVNGYTPLILDRYYQFSKVFSTQPGGALTKIYPIELDSRALNYLGVRYVIDQSVKQQLRTDSELPEHFRLLYDNGVAQVYENTHAFPRYYLVGTIGLVKSDADIGIVLRQDIADVETTAVYGQSVGTTIQNALRVRQPDTCDPAESSGSVAVAEFHINSIRLAVDAACTAILVTSDPYYPGWDATVDGIKTEVYPANLAFRSVIVPKGKHTVEFSYNPRIYAYGAALSFGSVLTLALFTKKFLSIQPFVSTR